MKEALFYEKTADGTVRCRLCRHNCHIADGRRGICNARENRAGSLYSLVYGKLIAENVDPIEKKPLFHFLPGSSSYSIASPGCNFHCRQCQNYTISQIDREAAIRGIDRTPREVVAAALGSGCASISYTYTEPTIFYEFALESALLAKENGLCTIFVTNGYICSEPLKRIAPVLDGANIDLKGFNETRYREYFGGSLAGVLDSIVEYKRLGIWVELTTLVIPGLNDSDEELGRIASFIARDLGVDTPWHVSQFYPTYRLTDRPRTPAATIRLAREIGVATGLKYVYTGNIVASGGEDTNCPNCGSIVITRMGYTVRQNLLLEGCCPNCGATVAGYL